MFNSRPARPMPPNVVLRTTVQENEVTAFAPEITDSQRLVRTYYRYVDEGNVELVNLFHPDARYKRPGYELMVGREALQRFYGGDRLIVAGVHQLLHIFEAGGSVAVEGTFAGTLKSGLKVTVPFSDFFDLEDAGIVHLIMSRRTYFDDQRV